MAKKSRYRFCFGPWNISEGSDPFGPPVRPTQPFDWKFAQLKKLGFDAMMFHDDDAVPDIEEKSEAEIRKEAKELKKRLDDAGIIAEMVAPRLWFHPATIDGAYTSNDPKARKYAIERSLRAIDIANILGTNLLVLWLAREGTYLREAKDGGRSVDLLVQAFDKMLAHDKRIRLAIEPKPNEPMDQAYVPTIGHALAIGTLTRDPKRMGGLIETAHCILAGLDPADEIAFALSFGKLWSLHLNDQNGLKYRRRPSLWEQQPPQRLQPGARARTKSIRPQWRVCVLRREGLPHDQTGAFGRPSLQLPPHVSSARGKSQIVRRSRGQGLDRRAQLPGPRPDRHRTPPRGLSQTGRTCQAGRTLLHNIFTFLSTRSDNSERRGGYSGRMKRTFLSLCLCLAALASPLFAGNSDSYVMHEWGTFTSVQGADGVQMSWNPFQPAELPTFVYDRTTAARDGRVSFEFLAGKGALLALQRLETPVMYFYSEKERQVNVHVDFPQGTMTEWYPRAQSWGPVLVLNNDSKTADRRSFLEWDIRVLADREEGQTTLPLDLSGSHYYAARATAANLLESVEQGKTQQEKFLFYRGVGNFQAPLQVSLSGNERLLQFYNSGQETLEPLFVLQIKNGTGSVAQVEQLKSTARLSVPLPEPTEGRSLTELSQQLSKDVASALRAHGLFKPEAEAMVNTWRDSWFAEQGVRVIYLLPQAWTDRVLPASLTPQPDRAVRVMVGRAEVITPSTEWQVLQQIVRYGQADPNIRAEAVAAFRALGLGRFAEPTVRRVLGSHPNAEFSRLAWALARQAGIETPAAKGVAAK